MKKEDALKLIDNHKNKLINPVEMLDWVYLRVFILMIPEEEFDRYMEAVARECSK